MTNPKLKQAVKPDWNEDLVAPSNKQVGDTFEQVVQRRLARRALLKGVLGGLPLFVVSGVAGGPGATQAQAQSGDTLTFQPIPLQQTDTVEVPAGYSSQVLIRWGDPLFPGAPQFDVFNQSAERQSRQFGYNCDYLMFFPFQQRGQLSSDRGILSVNHEYTNPEIMFPGYVQGSPTQTQVDVEIAAHGLSLIEVKYSAARPNDRWKVIVGSRYTQRITGETPMQITGPAAGHPRMRTSYDPTGTLVRGTLNNCGGGITPWGTLLTAEENFHQYFANADRFPLPDPPDDREILLRQRYGIPGEESSRKWELYHSRFDLEQEPNEVHRFGYIVEIDPYNPSMMPKKRTALGRFRHEASTARVGQSGQVAFYSGDDERFEYVYKFVTRDAYDPTNRAANMDLLDNGTLYVARFNEDGTGTWIPLTYGTGPLIDENGFTSQADICMFTRLAADAVNPTAMDRPEDIQPNPITGKVYITLTNNSRRTEDNVNAANPRPGNRAGHIIEMTEDNDDPTATSFRWEIFMLCGNPSEPEHQPTFFAGFPPALISPIANPDNIDFDNKGNLWIATDGQPGTLGGNDGMYAVPTTGPARGYVRQFLSGPMECEVASLVLNPENTTMFGSIQHPGEGGVLFEEILSNWPDNQQPPRPSVVAVVKTGGGSPIIGT